VLDRHLQRWPVLLLIASLLVPGPAAAYLDLASATVETLDNGLTVIVLEDPSFPVVSVQMLYRSGAADEVSGKTGLAHFLEHMAFRDSENFPDTELVSSIYAAGGEWHGYTWLDQTTYFATAPASELGLLLRIEADRMARLEIPAAEVAAEAGAILSEMHGYENDPATVLQDYVLYLSFLAHPYRNNTIGWESDVLAITHSDLLEFYQTHYRPGNAVLAIVGDVKKDSVMRQVRDLFGQEEQRPAPTAHYTPEPAQTGERRVQLHGDLDRKYFKFAYHAPSVSSPDFAAFLIVQELLSAGSGVSFLQNDWGTAARPGSALAGITPDLTTWYPPSEQDYVFTINGSIPADGQEEDIEAAIESGIDALRDRFHADNEAAGEALEHARERVFRELTFDVQTTEDAAHQLAFFAGLNALGTLVGLPQALDSVSVADIRGVLDRYLGKKQRVAGWYLPAGDAKPRLSEPGSGRALAGTQSKIAPAPGAQEPASPAVLDHLANGIPVMLQRSALSPTVTFKLIVPPADYSLPAGVASGEPAWGLVSLDFELLPDEVGAAISQAGEILASATPLSGVTMADAGDPDSLFEHYLQNLLGLPAPVAVQPVSPLLLVLSGDIDPDSVLQRLESGFGSLPAGNWRIPGQNEPVTPVEVESRLTRPVAQERLGYIVRIPGPRPRTLAAWQIALYIFSHGYEGRFGKEAISRQGLVYYVDSAIRTDGSNDWISLGMGVDPKNMTALKRLLKEELARLAAEPPSGAEIEEAKVHLLGRHLSAAQSNQELADAMARQWIWFQDVLEYDAWERQLAEVQRQDILDLLPEFLRGSIIEIRNPVSPR
jgi:zinc protease